MSLNWIFLGLWIALVVQRLFELKIARRNTKNLLAKGAVEYGQDHYWMMIVLHSTFLMALLVEYFFVSRPHSVNGFFLTIFLLAQIGRAWVIGSLRGRWTTRVLVIPGEVPVRRGPFKWLRHPNYLLVAIELISFPMTFNLIGSAVLFSILNGWVLLRIRIPLENRAWKSTGVAPFSETLGTSLG